MPCCDGTMPRTCHYTLGWPGSEARGAKSDSNGMVKAGNVFKRVALTQAMLSHPTAQRHVLMLRLILASLVLAVSILPLYAQSSLYTDRSGYTTGTQTVAA